MSPQLRSLILLFTLSVLVLLLVVYQRKEAQASYVQLDIINNLISSKEMTPFLRRGFEVESYSSEVVYFADPSKAIENKSIDMFDQQYVDEVKINNSKPYASILKNNIDDLKGIVGFRNMRTPMRVTKEYKLISCGIPKTMSTMLGAFQCSLSHPEKRMANYPYCEKEIRYFDPESIKKNLSLSSLNDWEVLFIKREPLDRFISGFMDRCVRLGSPCLGCYTNLECFVERLYQSLNEIGTKRQVLDFDEYHFTPQTWCCNLPETWNQIQFLRYSNDPSKSLAEDLMTVLKRKNVPENQQAAIQQFLLNNGTDHKTFESPLRSYFEDIIRNSNYIYNLILLIYESDYQVFGYDPNSL